MEAATLFLPPVQGAISSGVEHTVDIGGVTGSNPVSPIPSVLAWVTGLFHQGQEAYQLAYPFSAVA